MPPLAEHVRRLSMSANLSVSENGRARRVAGGSIHGVREVGMRLLHPPGLIYSRRRRWCDHQAQALKQHYRTLRRATPDELATLALAVLYVNVATGVLEAAILEGAVDEDPLVKNQVLVLKELIFVSSHQRTRLPLPCSCCKLTVDAVTVNAHS